MKKFFNYFLSAFAVIFAIPSFLILVSWNAIPGDALYALKTGLEDIALAITIKTPLASAFSLNFTQRRFSEANKLLAKKGSTLGYTLLVSQAKETKEIVVDQKDVKNAQELVKKIEEYQTRIEEKKLALASAPSPEEPACIQVVTPAKNPTTQECKNFPTPCDIPDGWIRVDSCEAKESVKTPIPTPTAAASASEVIADLDEVNEELEEIKEEIKRELPPQASERAEEAREEHQDRERNKKKED
ncbi:MAG: DUF5667 domain-containing protein [Patescibacteria group bacterium]